MNQYYKETVFIEHPTKVPEVTLAFWIIKILATTLGETGGDAVTMSMNLGYLVGTAIFATLFIAVAAQTNTRRFHPLLYWTVIVATTTVGTTLADFVDRSLGIGYVGGSSLLAALLVASLAIWHRTLGTVSISSIHSKPAEAFYWITILFSQTLGTALGELDGRFNRAWLCRRRAGFRRRACGRCRSLLVDQRLAHGAVLDHFRAHPAARRHGGRFPRQAARPWRPGA
jgi:hypothetical protein